MFDRRRVPGKAMLYVDLPTGQVSFHTPARGAGLDYGGEWDGAVDVSRERIMSAIDQLCGGRSARRPPGGSTRPYATHCQGQ